MSIHILGIGGSTRPHSSTEVLVQSVLNAAALDSEVTTTLISRSDLNLPPYEPGMPLSPAAAELVEEFRRADAVVIGSPGYHGGVSGLVKNALDYTEELRSDVRVYFDGLPVGCVATAYGWQAAVTTLVSLRSIAHALRGWPTPLGIASNVAGGGVISEGKLIDASVSDAVGVMAQQMISFVRSRQALSATA
ncbi:NADPH-dependent FMN reductase [Gordonia paraffinivorans]|uniref:NADPH-dependent FMN reductase n=1 Tax=Gordonia paraffinivorans TaxID=175628 RepID=UPI001E42DB8D|nr:NAD(P)H-dependent oxidoreductase [Gordonia paraffinivorans]MCD2147413.1 NAD(P)H-dependent oxidoreductase [Gordonia paraffinivorans]